MARSWLPGLRNSAIDPGLADLKTLTITGPNILPTTVTLGAGFLSRSAGWNLDAVVQDAYERSVWVYKCVDLYASHASRLPIVLQAPGDDGDVVVEHPLLRLLNVRANPLETGRQFKKRLAAQLLLSKVGVFVEITHSRAGIPVRLDLLAPDRVRIIPDPGGDYIDYFEFTQYDGVVRNLNPNKVLWIRDPHPTDPFSGVTPIDAAGVSIELDHLARIYNVSFIKRDARPGGIIGVDTDTLEDRELERIERVFQPGAHHAGKITAIGTGPGGIRYIDTSAKPRDMAYEHTSTKAKDEVLAAFGTPESMFGQTAGRTYDNAAQDEETWWAHAVNFFDMIADAFQEAADPGLRPRYDLSTVEALELPKKRARAEAREEFNGGLRTVKEYRDLRPELKDIDNAHTRALWLSPAKAPVPGEPEDAAALGVEDPTAGADPFAPPGSVPGVVPPTGVEDAAAEAALLEQVEATGTATAIEDGPAAAALAEARGETELPEQTDAADAVADARGISAATGVVDDPQTDLGPGVSVEGAFEDEDDLQVKSILANMHIKAAPRPEQEYEPDPAELERLELAVSAALDALIARQIGVVKARLESPKTRRGTRFWTPESAEDPHAGNASVDVEKVLAAERWARETGETLAPILEPAATASAAGVYEALAAAGVLGVASTAATATVIGRVPDLLAPTAEHIAALAAAAGTVPALFAAATAEAAMREWLDEMAVRMNDHLVEAQPSLEDLLAWMETAWKAKGRTFATSLATTVSQAVLGAARDNAAQSVTPDRPDTDRLVRVWRTRRDERVRTAHKEVDGHRRALGEPFEVGGYPVLFPSDPLAPASVARGCRCWLVYAWAQGARFTIPVSDETSVNPAA